MTLKIGFLQSLKGEIELDELIIKKLFEYKLSVDKCLHIMNMAELGITTVDTLTTVYNCRMLLKLSGSEGKILPAKKCLSGAILEWVKLVSKNCALESVLSCIKPKKLNAKMK